MDNEIHELIYGVPDELQDEYLVDELDLSLLSKDRIMAVQQLLKHPDVSVRNEAARMLTNWGDDTGFAYLVDLICNKPEEEWLGEIIHRLHGFDDTGRYLISALISYYITKLPGYDAVGSKGLDRVELNVIKHKLYPAIKKLVYLSQNMDFSAYEVLSLIRYGCAEYIPVMKEYLEAILQDANCCRYKIADAISGLIHIDKPWLVETLAKYGKRIKDYPKGLYDDDDTRFKELYQKNILNTKE